jgi:N-acyl homoserine lactone hydrolase
MFGNSPLSDLGHTLRLVDGEDVFGDGLVLCLPTHEHTPGHQSLWLQLDRGEIVLAADACYFCHRLEALERSGARIFFGHHPEFWQTAPKAPVPVA